MMMLLSTTNIYPDEYLKEEALEDIHISPE